MPPVITSIAAQSPYRPRPPQRRIAVESYPWLAGFSVLTGLAFFWSSPVISLLPLALTVFTVFFFRNPKREIQTDKEMIVAPADGTILSIERCFEARYLKKEMLRISIFMSPLNCHINRAPIAAKVCDTYYTKGSFKAAFKEKAMETNEHHAVRLTDTQGEEWMVVQIAGFIARRIVSYVRSADFLEQGERFGLIQFGSRTDLYCPLHVKVFVKPGQKVKAGKTILGRVLS